MNRKQFVSALAEKLASSEKLANEILTTVIKTIEESLLNGSEVNIKGFGKFSTIKRKARTGFNMHTKEAITVNGFTTAVFKAGISLKNKIKARFK